MYVKIKNNNIYLSDELAKEAHLKAGNFVFMFKLKGEKKYGFHKASREQAEKMVCYPIRKAVNGELYFTPTDPYLYFMMAVMGITMSKNGKRVNVEKQLLNYMPLFILTKKNPYK